MRNICCSLYDSPLAKEGWCQLVAEIHGVNSREVYLQTAAMGTVENQVHIVQGARHMVWILCEIINEDRPQSVTR